MLYSDVLHAKICHMNFIHSLEHKQYLGGGTKIQIKHRGGGCYRTCNVL